MNKLILIGLNDLDWLNLGRGGHYLTWYNFAPTKSNHASFLLSRMFWLGPNLRQVLLHCLKQILKTLNQCWSSELEQFRWYWSIAKQAAPVFHSKHLCTKLHLALWMTKAQAAQSTCTLTVTFKLLNKYLTKVISFCMKSSAKLKTRSSWFLTLAV